MENVNGWKYIKEFKKGHRFMVQVKCTHCGVEKSIQKGTYRDTMGVCKCQKTTKRSVGAKNKGWKIVELLKDSTAKVECESCKTTRSLDLSYIAGTHMQECKCKDFTDSEILNIIKSRGLKC